MSSIAEQVASRRTFAIISHPDAGKTTLAETTLARFFLAFDFLTNALN